MSAIVEKMVVWISLGKPKSGFPYKLGPEEEQIWSQLEQEIAEIEAAGGSVEVSAEIADVVVPKPVE